MADPEFEDSGAEDSNSPLSNAGNDADQNFGFSNVGTTSQACSSGSSSCTVSPDKKHWIEIVMLDQEGHPVPSIDYEITIPGGTVVPGSTDGKGRGRVDGIDAGNCKITFPKLDKDIWKKK